MAKRLSSKGYAAFVLPPANGTPAVYRVRIGPFKTRREADTVAVKTAEGRAVQALGHSLTSTRFRLRARRCVGPSAGAQLSSLRSPRLRLDRARAVAVDTRQRIAQRAFSLGLTTGVVYFTGTLYWITRVMVVYGGLQAWVAVLVNALLVAYLALFPALFAIVVALHGRKAGPPRCLGAPLVWVATELGRTYLFSGFPVGAARIQPGERAADRATRERDRRVRCVGARRRRERRPGRRTVRPPDRTGSHADGQSPQPVRAAAGSRWPLSP